jgi:peptide/nickel transport system substrate-binding protein
LCALVVLTLGLAACGGGEDTAENRPLRVALGALPPGLGNPFTANGTPSTTVWAALFDGLTRLDAEFNVVPALATTWRALDEKRWEFQLRPGVVFANGAPFDARAVTNAIAYLQSEQGRIHVLANELRSIESVEVIDPLTIVFHTTRPDAILPARLTALLLPEPGAWNALGPAGFAETPVGTGPYQLTSWRDGNGFARAVRVKTSWRQAAIGEIIFASSADASSRIQALLSGSADIGFIDYGDRAVYQARGLTVVESPATAVSAIALMTEREEDTPLKDVRVRQALNYAVNKEEIVAAIMNGVGHATGQPASRVSPGYDPAIEPYPYDPEKAKALLAQAGYPNGFTMKTMVAIESGVAAAMYQAVAGDLRAIGVEMVLEPAPFALWLRHYLSNGWPPEIRAFSLAWNAAPYNDVLRPMEYFSCLKPQPFFCIPALAEKVERAAQTLDDAERLALIRELSRDYHEAAPSIFIAEMSLETGVNTALRNVSIAGRVVEYEKLRWSEE